MNTKEAGVMLTPISLTSVKLHYEVLFFLFSSALCNIWYQKFLLHLVPFTFKASITW